MKLGIPEEVTEFIYKEAERSGFEVVDLNTRGGRTFSLEIILDKKEGITLDECSDFNRKVSAWIEEQKILELGYILDVCSPGLDRELKTDKDFSWATGKPVEVKTLEPVNDSNVIRGKLLERDLEQNVIVEKGDNGNVTIPMDNIVKVKLWVSIQKK